MTENQKNVMRFMASRPLSPRTKLEIATAIGISNAHVDNVLRGISLGVEGHLYEEWPHGRYHLNIKGLQWCADNLGMMFVFLGERLVCPACEAKLLAGTRQGRAK